MAMYDPRLYEEQRRKDIHDLVNQLELYIQQEDFTHPGFFALLRQLMVPPEVVFSITKTSEKIQIPGVHPDFKACLNRKIKERLEPLVVLYHKGLVYEGDVLLGGREREKRTKVIRTKNWRDKVRRVMGRGGYNDGSEPTDT